MCGIVGIVGEGCNLDIANMNEIQSHRGPDGGGVYVSKGHDVALAMKRLSIVSLHDANQPMVDSFRENVIVFNGEIYNAPELREVLVKKGYSFVTKNSDTEVLLYLYDLYKEDMLELLNGMFAFVVYDSKLGRLFGARDRVGIKPFYYYEGGGRFCFASELKSLTSLPYVDKELNLNSVHNYLSLQYFPGEDSVYKKISKLKPGSFFYYDIDKLCLNIHQYWNPNTISEGNWLSVETYDEAVSKVRAALFDAVDLWSRSDVPLGCSLSGGIDSTVVASICSSKNKLNTWSLGFSDSYAKDMDERGLARKIAKKIGSNHHEIIIESGDILKDLEAMVWHLDEPYAGGVPSWYIYKAMRGNVKVALTGSGGDEIFGNYGKWRYHQFTLDGAKRFVSRIGKMGLGECLSRPKGALYHMYMGERDKRRIWNKGCDITFNTSEYLHQLWLGSGHKNPKKAIPFVDLQNQLSEEFMFMTDRFSMAWSVEARTPLLDHRLIELCMQLPSNLFNHDVHLKKLLIDAAEGFIPDFVLKEKKRGFVLPIANWLREGLKPMLLDLLGEQYLKSQGLFDFKYVKSLVDSHLLMKRDNSDKLWTLLMFQIWYEKNK